MKIIAHSPSICGIRNIGTRDLKVIVGAEEHTIVPGREFFVDMNTARELKVEKL